MSLEASLERGVIYKKSTVVREKHSSHRINLLPDYPECAGHPASSRNNWVLTDFVGYRLAKLLRVADEDIKQKTKS